MKKFPLSTSVIYFLIISNTAAQADGGFKPFKVDISSGCAKPVGGNVGKGGLLFMVEQTWHCCT